MGIDKTMMLAIESMSWVNMSVDKEQEITNAPNTLISRQHDQRGLWESIVADIFTTNSKHYLWIIDYNGRFPVMKQREGLSADNLIKM